MEEIKVAAHIEVNPDNSHAELEVVNSMVATLPQYTPGSGILSQSLDAASVSKENAQPFAEVQAPSPFTPLMKAIVATGKYVGVEHCAKGGEGITFFLESASGEKRIGKCIPLLDFFDAATSKFELKEVTVLQRLSHPILAKSVEVDEFFDNGYVMISRERIEGKILSEELHEKKKFTAEEVVSLLKELLSGLDYLHDPQAHPSLDAPVIHRDIKPANIIRDTTGTLRLLDFGVSHISNQGSFHTKTRSPSGTLGYMPVEQFSGQGYPASDIYSLGVVAIELLLGGMPGGVEDIALGVKGTAQYSLRPTQSIPVGLCDVLNKMIARERSDRYQSAKEVLDALKGLSAKGERLGSLTPENKQDSLLLMAVHRLTESLHQLGKSLATLGGSFFRSPTKQVEMYSDAYNTAWDAFKNGPLSREQMQEVSQKLFSIGTRCPRAIDEGKLKNVLNRLEEYNEQLKIKVEQERRKGVVARFGDATLQELDREHAENTEQVVNLTNFGLNEELRSIHGASIVTIARKYDVPLAAAAILLKDVPAKSFTEAGFDLLCSSISENTKFAAKSHYGSKYVSWGYNDAGWEVDESPYTQAGPAVVMYARLLSLVDRDHSTLPDPSSDLFCIPALAGKLSINEKHIEALTQLKEIFGASITIDDLRLLCGKFVVDDGQYQTKFTPVPAIDGDTFLTLISQWKAESSETRGEAKVSLRDLCLPGMRIMTSQGIFPSSSSEAVRFSKIYQEFEDYLMTERNGSRRSSRSDTPTHLHWAGKSCIDQIEQFFNKYFQDLRNSSLDELLTKFELDLSALAEEKASIANMSYLPKTTDKDHFFMSYREALAKSRKIDAHSIEAALLRSVETNKHLTEINAGNLPEEMNEAIAEFFKKCWAHTRFSTYSTSINEAAGPNGDRLQILTNLVVAVRDLLQCVHPQEMKGFAEYLASQIAKSENSERDTYQSNRLGVFVVMERIAEVRQLISKAHSTRSGSGTSLQDWLGRNYKDIKLAV